MKNFFAVLIICQILFNSALAFAHVAADALDPHETVHVHAGTSHHAADTEDDDGGAHFHLCAAALNNAQHMPAVRPIVPATPLNCIPVSYSTSPPVPPPNA